jgi:hypothetical protein
MSAPVFEGTTPLVSDRYVTQEIAGEDLTIGQVVEITADWTVKKPTTNPSLTRCGICQISALNGKAISVLWRGLARAKAYGTITAGDAVGSGPGGTIQTVPAPTATDCNTSAGTAAAITKARNVMGWANAGAASGGSAYILLI